MKRNTRFLWGFLLAVVMVPFLSGCQDANSQLQEKFKDRDNGKGQPYSQQVPLSEMDFSAYMYGSTFPRIVADDAALILAREVALPCDVEYYCSKEDTKPALVIKKGTPVFIYPENSLFSTYGYGLMCWPDYEPGWRYGIPLMEEDFSRGDIAFSNWENLDLYYVKTEQLEKTAQAYTDLEKNKAYFSAMYQRQLCDPAKIMVQTVDRELYRSGAFCSPELSWYPEY